MGVNLPDLPPSASEDNINLGEKDSIRRRALWALEGKPDVPYSKVEIPELSTPVIEKMMFDFCKLCLLFPFLVFNLTVPSDENLKLWLWKQSQFFNGQQARFFQASGTIFFEQGPTSYSRGRGGRRRGRRVKQSAGVAPTCLCRFGQGEHIPRHNSRCYYYETQTASCHSESPSLVPYP
jgi:hypothetical protein